MKLINNLLLVSYILIYTHATLSNLLSLLFKYILETTSINIY